MNPFKYSDEKINESELMMALPSVIIGVAVLSLPRELAIDTLYSDGWVSILLVGVIFTIFAILGAKVAALFPNKSYYDYSSYLLSKPVAIVFLFIHVVIGIVLSGYSTRNIAYIAQQYLFNHTPMEVLALAFLLVVVYAVSGSRAGIFRLNMLFLPIILVAFLFVGIFNINWLETSNYFPLFKTEFKGYLTGMTVTLEAFLGFGIVLFYVSLIRKPKKLTKYIIYGMSIPIIFYIMIFIMTIGIFGNEVTGNLEFPTIELAKRVDIPGGILERIDPIVFSIWIMAIFTTAAVLLDVVVLLITSVFKKINKRMLTILLAPIIYYLGMFPQQIDHVKMITSVISQFTAYFTMFIIICLFTIAKIRGVKSGEKN